MSLQKYTESVEKMRISFFKEGRKFFYRLDPNEKKMSAYAALWQVGIGNENEKLIDIHVAKLWKEEDAILLVKALNEVSI